MGDACSACKENYYSDLDNPQRALNDVHDDRWINAITSDSLIGAQYVYNDDPNVINTIVDRINGEIALHIAVRNRNIEMIEFLCNNNIDINYKSKKIGQTALHIAAMNNDIQIIRLLLSYGASVDIKRKDGKIARDLCNRNVRREFNITRRRQLSPSNKTTCTTTHDNNNNNNNNNNININKRMIIKTNEIESRKDFLTTFGKKCGCEVDEIALLLDKLSEQEKNELWTKIFKKKDSCEKVTGVKKLMVCMTSIVNKKKHISIGNKKYILGRPDMTMVESLVLELKRKLPRQKVKGKQYKKRILMKNDLLNGKVATWLYEIHDSQEWQGMFEIYHLKWKIERIIWIGFYNSNDNKNKNEKCLIGLLPKDIVFHLLEFLRRNG